VSTKSRVDCSDLYHSAAEELKRLDNDIDKTILDLAKDVEARGVPKNKVAREVVRELTAREVLSPSRIYEGPGVEYKRESKKKVTEETFPRVENSSKEESSRVLLLGASSTGQSYTPSHKDERLNGKEESELIKEIAYLRGKNEELEKQLAEKNEQISELRQEDLRKTRQLEYLQELQTKLYDTPGIMIDAKNLGSISIEEGQKHVSTLEKYADIIQKETESGHPLPFGLYTMNKRQKKLVPVGLNINFEARKIKLSLRE
jgi:flagellar biosynthesis/type III secretory pathway protein FliH